MTLRGRQASLSRTLSIVDFTPDFGQVGKSRVACFVAVCAWQLHGQLEVASIAVPTQTCCLLISSHLPVARGLNDLKVIMAEPEETEPKYEHYRHGFLGS